MRNCYIIAEAGVNHNGCLDMALKLVESAAEAGADAIKFQTYKTENIVSKTAEKAQYQIDATGLGTQYEMLKKYELNEDAHQILIKACIKNNIEFLSTPFDLNSLEFLLSLGIKKIKIPSGELTNLPFLREIALKQLPIILSTGMSNLEEIKDAVETIENTWTTNSSGLKSISNDNRGLSLLHCVSCYPTEPSDVNLQALNTLLSNFNYPIGFSDHTKGIEFSIAAIALGASIVEKHLTLDISLEGPDHKSSIEPNEFKKMVSSIRNIEKGMGDGKKVAQKCEIQNRDVARKSLFVNKVIEKGQKLKNEDIICLRPGTGILPKEINQVVGMEAKKKIEAWTILQWNDLKS